MEYDAEHQDDIEIVMTQLRDRKNPPISSEELRAVEQQLSNPTTAYYRGSSFAITRDIEDHFQVVELPEERRAA